MRTMQKEHKREKEAVEVELDTHIRESAPGSTPKQIGPRQLPEVLADAPFTTPSRLQGQRPGGAI
jgi:hypothetical protein